MEKKKIAELLGSEIPISLETKNVDGPLTYLHLIKEVNSRFLNKRGRPTDYKKTKYHNIPLTIEVWKKLNEKAKLIPSKKTLSPSQLAAFLIEDGLKNLDKEIKQYDLEPTN